MEAKCMGLFSYNWSSMNDPNLKFFWQIYIYDGKEGDNGVSLGGERAHKGGIYGVSRIS